MHKTWDLVSVYSIHPSSYHHTTVTTSMHSPTYVSTHTLVQRDHHRRQQILICNHHKLSHNCQEQVTTQKGHRDTKNHGEMISCITHHVCQEIQGVDEMVLMMLMKVLMLVCMMPLPEGGWSPPEAIPAAVPPSDLHRWRPADSFFMCFRSTAAASSRYTSGEPYIVRFRSRRVSGTKIEAKRTSGDQKASAGAP